MAPVNAYWVAENRDQRGLQRSDPCCAQALDAIHPMAKPKSAQITRPKRQF
jgi:hypothetical protein